MVFTIHLFVFSWVPPLVSSFCSFFFPLTLFSSFCPFPSFLCLSLFSSFILLSQCGLRSQVLRSWGKLHHRQYRGCSPVLQRVLRNKYQLLRYVTCSLFHRGRGMMGSNHDMATCFIYATVPNYLPFNTIQQQVIQPSRGHIEIHHVRCKHQSLIFSGTSTEYPTQQLIGAGTRPGCDAR